MGSKKHKKHKRSHDDQSSQSELKPLKLVLKVGSNSSTMQSDDGKMSTEYDQHQNHSSRHYSTSSHIETHQFDHYQISQIDESCNQLTPSTSQSINTHYDEHHHAPPSSSSSSKKLKKKKSKKKHRKHSHHHHHHHHHHHRRRSSCSHHSRTSSHNQSDNLDYLNDKPLAIALPEEPQPLETHKSPTLPALPPPPLPVLTPFAVPVSSAPLPPPPQVQPQPAVLATLPPPSVAILSTVPPKPSIPGKCIDKSNFQAFLDHLWKQLQRRDPQGYFAWPVTDTIAPGYSSIIQQPMDLSTMKKKLEQHQYENLLQFKADVKLICDNAMHYNHPDTVYYKAARKLWHHTRDKLLNKSYLHEVTKNYPGLTDNELRLDVNEEHETVLNSTSTQVRSEEVNTVFIDDGVGTGSAGGDDSRDVDCIDEESLKADQILEAALKASQIAAQNLSTHRPMGSHLSYLRQTEDGATCLGLIGSNTVRRVELDSYGVEEFAGLNGQTTTTDDDEEKEISKDEQNLLMSTYGEDDVGLQYAHSLMQFANGNEYVLSVVDYFLDQLTNNLHSKLVKKYKEDISEGSSAASRDSVSKSEVAKAICMKLSKIMDEPPPTKAPPPPPLPPPSLQLPSPNDTGIEIILVNGKQLEKERMKKGPFIVR